MAVVKPIELTPGLARNQTLTGRVCLFDSATVGKVGRANDYVEPHLVVEEGLYGTLYIEAWRDQARRLTQVAHGGKILNSPILPSRPWARKHKGNVHLWIYTVRCWLQLI